MKKRRHIMCPKKGSGDGDAAVAEPKAPAKPKKSELKKSDVFIFTGDGGEIKVAPQARRILECLEAAGGDGMTRSQLLEAMSAVVETRQPIDRILTYYEKALVESGTVTIESNGGSE